MVRGSKEKYTEKQKRKAEHIEDSYEEKGVGSCAQKSFLENMFTKHPIAE